VRVAPLVQATNITTNALAYRSMTQKYLSWTADERYSLLRQNRKFCTVGRRFRIAARSRRRRNGTGIARFGSARRRRRWPFCCLLWFTKSYLSLQKNKITFFSKFVFRQSCSSVRTADPNSLSCRNGF
jgi:hypothetical protein